MFEQIIDQLIERLSGCRAKQARLIEIIYQKDAEIAALQAQLVTDGPAAVKAQAALDLAGEMQKDADTVLGSFNPSTNG